MALSVGEIQGPLASVTIDDIRGTLGELLPTLSLSTRLTVVVFCNGLPVAKRSFLDAGRERLLSASDCLDIARNDVGLGIKEL